MCHAEVMCNVDKKFTKVDLFENNFVALSYIHNKTTKCNCITDYIYGFQQHSKGKNRYTADNKRDGKTSRNWGHKKRLGKTSKTRRKQTIKVEQEKKGKKH